MKKIVEKIKNEWKNLDTFEKIGFPIIYIGLAIIIVLTILLTIGLGYKFVRLQDCETKEQTCIVVDKDSHIRKVGGITSFKKEIVVELDNDIRWDIEVNSPTYSEIEIGDKVECLIYYDEDGIIHVSLQDEE